MQFQTWKIHVLRVIGDIQPAQNQPQAIGMTWLNPRFATRRKEPLQTFVFEASNHRMECNPKGYNLQGGKKLGPNYRRNSWNIFWKQSRQLPQALTKFSTFVARRDND